MGKDRDLVDGIDADSYVPDPQERQITQGVMAELDAAKDSMIAALNKADEAFPDSIDELRYLGIYLEGIQQQIRERMDDILES